MMDIYLRVLLVWASCTTVGSIFVLMIFMINPRPEDHKEIE